MVSDFVRLLHPEAVQRAPAIHCRRYLAIILLVPAFAVGSLPVPYSYRHSAVGALVAPTAEAKKLRERARSLLDRIRGSSMPKGIVKTMAASKPHRSIVRLERNPPKTLSPAGVDEAPGSGD